MTPVGGLLQRWGRHLTRTSRQLEDDELQTRCDVLGTTPIGDVPERAIVEVSGVVRSLTMPDRERVPALAVELYDGTGALEVVWLGRREILGVRPGVYLRVRGRACLRRGHPTMFNPSYEIVPATPAGPGD